MEEKLKQSISLILPVYNEEALVEDALRTCVQALERDFEDYEIIVIDDGCKDNTWNIVKELASTNERIRAVQNLINLNQGVSIQRGIALAAKDYVIHNGVDLPLDPRKIKKLIATIGDTQLLVIQRKVYAGATLWRKLISRINIWLRMLLFPFHTKGITDMNFVQVYKRELFPSIMPLAKSPAFTTPEMILRANHHGYKVAVQEFEFQAREVGQGSLGKLHDITWTIYDMFRFRYLLWIGLERHGLTK